MSTSEGLRLLQDELFRLLETDPSAFELIAQQLDDVQVNLAREDPSAFVTYVLRDEETGEPVVQAPYHDRLQQACTESKSAVIWGHVELGKAEPIHALVPTPTGFKEIGSLRVGDKVYALDGTATRVVSKTPVHVPGQCYRVTFSDNTHMDVSGGHHWLVWSGDRYAKGKSPKTMTTQELLDAGLYVRKKAREYPLTKFRVPLAAPVQFPEAKLLLHPYVLGAWLGDGTAAKAEITGTDEALLRRVQALWPGDWRTSAVATTSKPTWRIFRRGSTQVLRDLDVESNKHIPEMYKTASIAQRLELLRGLMDRTGLPVAHDGKNTVELCFVSKRLAEDATELVRSLGEKVTLREDALVGYDHPRYRLHWTVSDTNPFWLPRKAAVIEARERSKRLRVKAITAIDPIEPVPMVCIGVGHPSHTYISGRHYTVTHNCVTESTIFYLEDGRAVNALTIQKLLREGPVKVLTLNQKTQQREWVPVKSVVYDGHVPCMRLTTQRGEETTVSHNHPFLIRRNGKLGWAAVKSVRAGDEVIIAENVPVAEEHEKLTSSAAAFELGVLYSMMTRKVLIPKGHVESPEVCLMLTSPNSRTSTQNAPDYVRILRQLSEKYGWRILWRDGFNEQTVRRLTFATVEGLADWAAKLGIIFTRRFASNRWWCQDYHSSHPAFFPPQIYQMDRAAIRSFLAGLFFSRFGFKEPNGIRKVEGLSPELAAGVMLLARRAGLRVKRSWHFMPGRHKRYQKHDMPLSAMVTLSFQREDIYPLVCEAFHRVKNPFLDLVTKTDAYWLGHASPEVVGLSGRARPTRTPKPPEDWVYDKVRAVASVGVHATYAVTINSDEHTHLTDNILSHNTQQITIGRVLWEIGRNPNIRICILQATEGLAESVVGTIKRYIEHSPEYRKVFPNVRRGDIWTSKLFTVERPPEIKDPTVIASGVGGNVLGRRFDLLVGDDICTDLNTKTEYQRDETYRWTVTTPMSRLTRRGRAWLIGNAWHIDDLLHRFAAMKGFNSYKFPARDPVTKEPYWPDRWSGQRIQDFEETRPAWEVARAIDCKPLNDESGRFRKEWFEAAYRRGRGLFGKEPMCYGLATIPAGCQVFTGVDLGISDKVGTDLTAMVTLMVKPDNRIVMLNILTGNWDANEIIEQIIDVQKRFKSFVYVESVFSQRWILQLVRRRAPHLPVFPFQTRGTGSLRNKRHTIYGVEAVAAELSAGLWDIPTTESGVVDPEILGFERGCMAYTPEDHTADTLMAAWIAQQGCRKQTGINGYVGAAEHSIAPFVEVHTEKMTPEERAAYDAALRTQQAHQRNTERQRGAEGWWSDLRGTLELHDRTEEEIAVELGL